ncbi:DUF6597 domain-containing transcriptional factor [Flavobacterium sp.]|uniref:DUF6597 domain-containing transcriptional factor n=1 Tax=Flavobacterium sp. TaxID=239 RepID=UPI002FDA5EFB
MIYKEYLPNKLLTDFVNKYWWFDNTTKKKLDYTILPDGSYDLIISFDKYQQNEISLTGIWTKQVDVSIKPNQQLFGIRFKLLAIDYILQQSISTLCDSEELKENDFWQLDKISFSQLKITTEKLDKIMLSILGSQKGIDMRKQLLFNLLYETKGQQTIEQYLQQLFWTSRQINRYFKKRFGISLKSYCKILKLSASYMHLKKGQLFPEQNYFDQSHFINDLKSIQGKFHLNYLRIKTTDFYNFLRCPMIRFASHTKQQKK